MSQTACFPVEQPLITAQCFKGDIPRVSRAAEDEMFDLLRREHDRALSASPVVRARMVEGLRPLFPDTSDRLPSWDCGYALADEGIALLEKEPLVFDRELVARLRTIHDPDALLKLALREEATLPDYRPLPSESGPFPPRSFLRYQAFASIPVYWNVTNRPEARRLIVDRLRSSTDSMEQLLLNDAAKAVIGEASWDQPERLSEHEGPLLLRQFISDVHSRLSRTSEPVSLELVLLRLPEIGHYGVRGRVESGARGVVNTILAAKGDLPVTKGIPGAARDLAEAAYSAQYYLDTPQKGTSYSEPPPPRHKRFDPRVDMFRGEPAGGAPPEEERAKRVRELDSELATLQYNVTRCYVIDQLGNWLSEAEQAARFESFIEPAFQGEKNVVLNGESLCRLRVALGMRGADKDKRQSLALRMLNTPVPDMNARDRSKDIHGPAIAYPAYEDPVRQIAAFAVASEPDWVDTRADLRAWLGERAMEPIPNQADPTETWTELAPLFERLLAFHLSGNEGASKETARAILLAWISSIRTVMSAPPAGHIYRGVVVKQRLRALGDLAKKAGIASEARALFAEMKTRADAAVAAKMLDLD